MGQINVGKGLDVPDLGTTCRALPAYSLFTTADKRWVSIPSLFTGIRSISPVIRGVGRQGLTTPGNSSAGRQNEKETANLLIVI